MFNWVDVKSKTAAGDDVFGKFPPDSETRIRFITEPVEYPMDWEKNGKPQRRYCVWALAMDDGNKAKIYEFSISVMRKLAEMVNEHSVNPWEKEAYALKIVRTGSTKDNTRYEVIESKQKFPLPPEYTPEKIAAMLEELRRIKGVQNPDLKNDAKTGDKTNIKPNVNPEVKPDAKNNVVKTDAKSDSKANAKTDAKPDEPGVNDENDNLAF